MALRFDAAADRALITANLLNYNSAYTWMGHVLLVSDLNANSTILGIDDNSTSNIDHLRTTTDGVTLETRVAVGGTASQATAAALTVGTWAHVALVRSSATALNVYIDGVLAGSTNTRNVGARASATRMELGAIGTGNANRGDIRVAYMKAWSVALTAAEIEAERYSVLPIKLANLYGWWPTRPGATERVKDYSGNGNSWADTGLTDEDPPPIRWDGSRRNRAKTGTQYSQSTAGTLTSAGALAKRAGKGLAGTLSSSGALIRQARKLVAGTLTSAGSLIKRAAKNLAGTLTSSGALATSRIYIKALAGTLTSSGALVRRTGKALAGTLTSSGTATKRTSRSLAGTLSSSGALATARVYLKALAGTLTSSGVLVRRAGKALAGTLSSSGTLTKQDRKLVSGTLASSGAVVKQTAKYLAGTLTSSGTAVISRMVAWVRNVFRVAAEDRTSSAAVGARFTVASESRSSTASRGADFSVADDDRTSET